MCNVCDRLKDQQEQAELRCEEEKDMATHKITELKSQLEGLQAELAGKQVCTLVLQHSHDIAYTVFDLPLTV